MSAELEQVRSIVVRVTHHIDRHDWRALRALYADDVETDYTSLFGGAPQRQRADDLVAGWQQALAAVSTQHLLGPIDVELRGIIGGSGVPRPRLAPGQGHDGR